MSLAVALPRLRRGLRVRGTVQGVGFRPAICRLATELELAGFVRNDAAGVLIEVEGAPDSVTRFVAALPAAMPAVAQIESVETTALPFVGERGFRIAPSAVGGRGSGESPAAIPPDSAPCADCLRELADPHDRRYRYPFINCTACGPRFTIIRSLPYDRSRTTMDAFPLCELCQREYVDPTNRRFHAEANACPSCGPALAFLEAGVSIASGDDALRAAVAALAAGAVVALKGAGGFLLAADARNDAAVLRLRDRKRRPHKPFALMARDLGGLERIVALDDPSRRALESPARPILLARRRSDADVAASVAPGLDGLGVALPATPLQHLLVDGHPDLLVMTSGNLSDEPIARRNDEALRRLADVADAFLVHDRDVHARADDSVVRVVAGAARAVRRSRGYVPDAFALPIEADAPTLLAVGAETKTTMCLVAGGEAFLSQHLGDVSGPDGRAFFDETVTKLCALTGSVPGAFARDLHPDYASSRWAQGRGLRDRLPCLPVQHHHAHVASCLVEHGHRGPVVGVVFDGTGLGTDGTLWGGEFLVADLGAFRRVGHLRPIALPGGEAAVRAPWRLAVAALHDAGEALDVPALASRPIRRREDVAALVERTRLAPKATGAGRWFDAVAALCGVRSEISYDGQAAVELEAAAAEGPCGAYDFGVDGEPGEPFVVDLRPVVRAVAHDVRRGVEAAVVSARFHATLGGAIAAACVRARAAGGPSAVALSGGCFQNRRLTELAKAELEAAGFEVLLHRRVPCNDGGLALGQAAVAAFKLASERRGGRRSACA